MGASFRESGRRVKALPQFVPSLVTGSLPFPFLLQCVSFFRRLKVEEEGVIGLPHLQFSRYSRSLAQRNLVMPRNSLNRAWLETGGLAAMVM